MREEPFEVAIDGGILAGHRGGEGAPALLLHGGAAVPDYMGSCAELLDGLFATIRYTQRGTPPSTGGPPFTIEQHVADALSVLDAFELDRAWAIGHSWGGHLALHIALTHPQRLLGVLAIDPLGADGSAFPELDANLRRRMSDGEVARVDELEARRRAGAVTHDELVERFALVWPHYFLHPTTKVGPPNHIGVDASIGTNRSLSEHFERRTLMNALPDVRLPALFVHGEQDPLPVWSTEQTAALVPGSRVLTIPDCGHFPWLEQPAALRDAVVELLQLNGLAGVHELLTSGGIDYWLFGGWAVDFYAGEITRKHDDIDIAVWLDDHARAADLLAASGWRHVPHEDEDGGTGYERDGVRVELTFLVRDERGEVFVPVRSGPVRWSKEAFGYDTGELNGVRARLIPLAELKSGKSRARDDATDAAKDRADSATLSRLP
jgi:proline iminopeptidase